ncbi:MAG TPA: hypothetical protein VFU21_32685 [Kofleriaceae bacterium]|nr:hypothetical protein [Kofleriaceae bacterium]
MGRLAPEGVDARPTTVSCSVVGVEAATWMVAAVGSTSGPAGSSTSPVRAAPAAPGRASSLAMPKSSSLGRKRPDRVITITLPGLRSRWTMPFSCALCTTSQMRSRSGTKRSSGSGPPASSRWLSGVPRTSSIAIQIRPSRSTPKA